jgi:hypothetical protein
MQVPARFCGLRAREICAEFDKGAARSRVLDYHDDKIAADYRLLS